jgi:hypothetical protein
MILLDIGTIIVIFNFIIDPKCLPIKDLRARGGSSRKSLSLSDLRCSS